MDDQQYHVLLQSRRIGPYDRRTIIGMRIKGTLDGDSRLQDAAGRELSVAELIARGAPPGSFAPQRTGSFSVVQAVFTAALLQVRGRGAAIPAFKGEVQVRVQPDVLRIAGRFRRGLRWREDRVKLPLQAIVHCCIEGSRVMLGLRPETAPASAPAQAVELELFSPEAAAELRGWLPQATPWPVGTPPAAGQPRAPILLWLPGVGIALVVAVLAAVLILARRV